MNDCEESRLNLRESSATSIEPSLAGRATRGSAWVMATSLWQLGCGFVANVLLARLLFPSDFGQFALALFFVLLLRIQPKLGIASAFAQQKDTSGEAIGTYLVLESIASLATIALVWAASFVLPGLGYSSVVAKVAIVLSFSFFLESLGGIGNTLLDKELHFKESSLLRSLLFPLSYAPAFWFAIHGFGVWSIVIQSLTYNGLFAATVWPIMRRRVPGLLGLKWRFDAVVARSFLKFGITVGIAGLAGMLLTQFDNFLIGTFVSVSVLGLYERAYRTAEWPGSLFYGVINRSVFFTYSKLQNDPPRLRKASAMVLWAISTTTLPVALTVFIVAPDLLFFLYGDRWVPATPFLRLLVAYSFLRPFWENGGAFFIATGKPQTTTVSSIIQVVVLILCGVPLTLLFGAIGTCVAVGLAFVIGVALLYVRMHRQIRVEIGGLMSGPVLATAATILSYLLSSHFAAILNRAGFPGMVTKGCFIFIIFYTFTLLFQPSVTRERIQQVFTLITGHPAGRSPNPPVRP